MMKETLSFSKHGLDEAKSIKLCHQICDDIKSGKENNFIATMRNLGNKDYLLPLLQDIMKRNNIIIIKYDDCRMNIIGENFEVYFYLHFLAKDIYEKSEVKSCFVDFLDY